MEENTKKRDIAKDGVSFLRHTNDRAMVIVTSFDKEYVVMLKSEIICEEEVRISIINSYDDEDTDHHTSIVLNIIKATQLRDFLNQFLES
jgi:hypothetical protein